MYQIDMLITLIEIGYTLHLVIQKPNRSITPTDILRLAFTFTANGYLRLHLMKQLVAQTE